MTILETQGLAARHAERVLAVAGTAQKNRALEAMARALKERESAILAENQKDLAAARESGMKASLLDRLALSPQRIDGIVEGVRQVAALPDPIGCVTRMEKRPNGLVIGKRRVPLGVIGIIYEARPNVTVDAAALCLKSGNAVILRGGKEAFRSNKAFVAVMRDALEAAGLPRDCVALVEDTSRESANELMGLTEYLDVLIPRGGAGLIRSVVENARVPVIQTGVGVCHIYVHERADLDMAARILHNAKTSRPSVCNAAECLLVHAQVAEAFLPKAKALLDQNPNPSEAEIKKAQEKYGVKITYRFPQYEEAPEPTAEDAPVVTELLAAVKKVFPKVAPKVGGRLEAIHFDVGDSISGGSVIAKIEDIEYKQSVDQSQADLEVAKAQMRQAEVMLDLRRREYERYKALDEKKATTQALLESAETAFHAQEATYNMQRAEVKRREAILDNALLKLGDCVITADWPSGARPRFVGSRVVDQGALLSPNQPILTVAFTYG